MKIVIAGAGSVGRYMAERLAEGGHQITLVDSEPKPLSRADDLAPRITTVLGDACDLDTLHAAGLSSADVVAAVTGDDEDNLVISLLCKQEFGVPRVVARVNNPSNEWMFNEMWGVDMSVSTPHLLTALVEEAVSIGSFVRLLSLEHGKARLAEVTLATGSPAISSRIMDLGLPRDSTIVAVLREGHVVVPHGDTVLAEGDEVLLLISGDDESVVRTALIGVGA